MVDGVSVVICCYNSAKRLPQTLRYLSAQQVRIGLKWEVIIIDNASTDSTSQVALEYWSSLNISIPLRIVHEPRLGLANARIRAMQAASYEIVSFVDDDNWVCAEWVELTSEIMSKHSGVGACGGFIEAVCEIIPPKWFENYKQNYAIGPQASYAGYIFDEKGWLCGAGLTFRKIAWLYLINNGFHFLNQGRKGATLNSGEDNEICFALRLAGWHLWYDPRLKLKHFLPSDRLKWSYLRRLYRGFGMSYVAFNPYQSILNSTPKSLKSELRRNWLFNMFFLLIKLIWHFSKFYFTLRFIRENEPEVLIIESEIGQLSELLRIGKTGYKQRFLKIQNAPWRIRK